MKRSLKSTISLLLCLVMLLSVALTGCDEEGNTDTNTGGDTTVNVDELLADFSYVKTESGYEITGVKDKSKTTYVIPDIVTSISSGAFDGCSNLEYNEYDNAYYLGNENNPYVVLIKVKSKDIISCNIHSDTKFICYGAFSDCSNLTSITIPDNVTSIGDWAFSDCHSLTSITILNGVTSIGGSAFLRCVSLTSIVIPDSVTSIGSGAFVGCDSLGYNEDDNAYYLGNEDNPYLWLRMVKSREITSFTIRKDTKFVGDYAFSGCDALTSVTIPSSVTSIGGGAFCNCSSLTNITLPDSVKRIGIQAFYGCSSLTSITMPNSVTSIDVRVFERCSSLTSITIPDSVTSIGHGAFSDCRSLTSVIFKNTTGWKEHGRHGTVSVIVTDPAENATYFQNFNYDLTRE